MAEDGIQIQCIDEVGVHAHPNIAYSQHVDLFANVKNEKIRAVRFDESQRRLLVQLIGERIVAIESSAKVAEANDEKNAAWDDVTFAYNAANWGAHVKTKEQLREAYRFHKKKFRKITLSLKAEDRKFTQNDLNGIIYESFGEVIAQYTPEEKHTVIKLAERFSIDCQEPDWNAVAVEFNFTLGLTTELTRVSGSDLSRMYSYAKAEQCLSTPPEQRLLYRNGTLLSFGSAVSEVEKLREISQTSKVGVRPNYNYKRAPNMLKKQKDLFFSLVDGYKSVLECKERTNDTVVMKEAAWDEITEKFNSMLKPDELQRTKKQLQEAYRDKKKKDAKSGLGETRAMKPSYDAAISLKEILLKRVQSTSAYKKKHGGAHMTRNEKAVFTRLLQKYSTILNRKSKLGVISQAKRRAWERITAEFNAVGFTSIKTRQQIQEAYRNMKKRQFKVVPQLVEDSAKDYGMEVLCELIMDPDDIASLNSTEGLDDALIVHCNKMLLNRWARLKGRLGFNDDLSFLEHLLDKEEGNIGMEVESSSSIGELTCTVSCVNQSEDAVHLEESTNMESEVEDKVISKVMVELKKRRFAKKNKMSLNECIDLLEKTGNIDMMTEEGLDKTKPICRVCDKELPSLWTLRRHMSKHEGTTMKLVCEVCGTKVNSRSNLRQHMALHGQADRQYACEFCGKTVPSRSTLAEHRRQHTKERPFVCQFCGKSYRAKAMLQSHVKQKHTREGLHYCSYCNRGFAVQATLKVHEARHRGEGDFECQMCSKKFLKENVYIRHMYGKHKVGDLYKCHCGSTFTYQKHLDKHQSIMHALVPVGNENAPGMGNVQVCQNPIVT